MKLILRSVCLSSAAFLLLTACSNTKDTAEQPVELSAFNPETQINILWKVNSGKGTGKYQFKLQPYLQGESLYTVDYRGQLSAFNKNSGKRLWQVDTGLPVSGGVGGGGEWLYIGTRDGRLVAFRQSDGSPVWEAALSSELLAAPVRDLGIVVVRTVDGNIQAFGDGSGEKLWSYRQSVPVLSLRGNADVVISGGRVIVAGDNGQLTALSLLEGRILWETRIAVPGGRSELDRMVDIDGTPLLEQGIIYTAAFQGRIAAVAADQGQTLWARDKSVYLGLALNDDNVYAVDEMSHIWAMDRNSGATVWVQDKLHARPLTTPVLYGKFLLTADFEGFIHLLAVDDGRFVGRLQLDDEKINVMPLVDRDIFYVLDTHGRLAAMHADH